jgi:hypothetical protein
VSEISVEFRRTIHMQMLACNRGLINMVSYLVIVLSIIVTVSP